MTDGHTWLPRTTGLLHCLFLNFRPVTVRSVDTVPLGTSVKKYNSTSGAPAMASTSPTFHLVHPRMEHSTID